MYYGTKYHEVVPTALWAVVEKDLAPLKDAVLNMYSETVEPDV